MVKLFLSDSVKLFSIRVSIKTIVYGTTYYTQRLRQNYEILLIRINQDVPISEQEAFPSNLLSWGHVALMKRLMCNH